MLNFALRALFSSSNAMRSPTRSPVSSGTAGGSSRRLSTASTTSCAFDGHRRYIVALLTPARAATTSVVIRS
ncbi:hypothetical protein CSX11_01305 [Mycobacterium goodii]|nr:hypothetical protein CSX11_01305 [Mycolicibacterium goodii]